MFRCPEPEYGPPDPAFPNSRIPGGIAEGGKDSGSWGNGPNWTTRRERKVEELTSHSSRTILDTRRPDHRLNWQAVGNLEFFQEAFQGFHEGGSTSPLFGRKTKGEGQSRGRESFGSRFELEIFWTYSSSPILPVVPVLDSDVDGDSVLLGDAVDVELLEEKEEKERGREISSLPSSSVRTLSNCSRLTIPPPHSREFSVRYALTRVLRSSITSRGVSYEI